MYKYESDFSFIPPSLLLFVPLSRLKDALFNHCLSVCLSDLENPRCQNKTNHRMKTKDSQGQISDSQHIRSSFCIVSPQLVSTFIHWCVKVEFPWCVKARMWSVLQKFPSFLNPPSVRPSLLGQCGNVALKCHHHTVLLTS